MKKIFTNDEDLIRLQDNVAESLEKLEKNALLKGIIIENVAITTSFADIEHKLGRVPIGYSVISSTDVVALARSMTNLPDKFLKLKGSVSATVSLYVF